MDDTTRQDETVNDQTVSDLHEADSSAEPSSENDDVNALASLESMINQSLSRISVVSEELKKQNEMLESVLDNDQVYKNHLEQAKEANKVKNKTKAEVLKRPDVKQTAERVKELRAEVKDTRDSLSGYLYEYAQKSNSDTFETAEGDVLGIVYSAKLVKKS